MEIKSYPLTGTAKYKTVIRKCSYQHTSGTCHRQSLYRTFFKGTAYSRRHDVGSCVGVCGTDGHECKAVDSRKVAIEGPNGRCDSSSRYGLYPEVPKRNSDRFVIYFTEDSKYIHYLPFVFVIFLS